MINIAVIGFKQDFDELFKHMKTHNVNFICGCNETYAKGYSLDGIIYLPGYEKMENLDRILYILKGQLISYD